MGAIALAGLAAVGTIMEGEAQKRQLDAEAAAAEMQARIDENEAKQIEARGALEQRRLAEEHAAGESIMLSNVSASGAVATEGAGLLAQAKQITNNDFTRLIQSYNVNEAIKSKLYEAEVERVNAANLKKQGKAARNLSYIKAGTGMVISGFQNRTPNPSRTMMNPRTGATGTVKQSDINKWLSTP